MSNRPPFVPWMHSLLDRMKELYNKPNARTIAEALPDIAGSGADLSAYRTALAQDLIDGAQDNAIAAKYTKPDSGIPKSDLADNVQTSLGKADTAVQAETVVEVSGATPTITPENNAVYNCGEVASLTISNPTATGAYSVVFTSGATATTTTFPATILGLEDFAAEANTLYEINVWNNRAVVGSWAVTP